MVAQHSATGARLELRLDLCKRLATHLREFLSARVTLHNKRGCKNKSNDEGENCRQQQNAIHTFKRSHPHGKTALNRR